MAIVASFARAQIFLFDRIQRKPSSYRIHNDMRFSSIAILLLSSAIALLALVRAGELAALEAAEAAEHAGVAEVGAGEASHFEVPKQDIENAMTKAHEAPPLITLDPSEIANAPPVAPPPGASPANLPTAERVPVTRPMEPPSGRYRTGETPRGRNYGEGGGRYETAKSSREYTSSYDEPLNEQTRQGIEDERDYQEGGDMERTRIKRERDMARNDPAEFERYYEEGDR